jgi:Smg protein
MFEVLVYLFENYYQSENYPDQDTLARKLTAAGFENDEISEALDWLNGLVGPGEGATYEHIDAPGAFRAFAQAELAKLSAESRGFLIFLESARVLSPGLRELIIDKAMAVEDDVVELEKFKVIVLMVLWTRRGDVDTLMLEELLPTGGPQHIH